MKEISTIIKQLSQISIEAGQKIMEIYNASEDIVYEKKDDDSPLTAADKASNDIICQGLENLDFKFPIISEENKQIDYSQRKSFDYAWMVDPLDGTKEFIKRNGEFTVNIALIKSNQTILGIVYVPASKELFYAIKGFGAFQVIDGEDIPLKASQFTMQDEGLRVVCSRSHLSPETKEFMDKLNNPETVSKGSSLKFLVLAQGNAELYPRLAPTMEWDTAAAQIILEEAGGQVLNAESMKALQYNKENLLNPYFIARGSIREN